MKSLLRNNIRESSLKDNFHLLYLEIHTRKQRNVVFQPIQTAIPMIAIRQQALK